MGPALYFQAPLACCDFIRLHGSQAAAPPFALYVLAPGADGRHPVVLVGVAPRPALPAPTPVEVELRGDLLHWRWRGVEQSPRPVVAVRHSQSLLTLLGPVPWRGEVIPDWVVLWFHRPAPEALGAVVYPSLRLGNDRIQLAAVVHGGTAGALLRIEAPSYFLLQDWLARGAGELEVFYPAAEALYLPWGYSHPLVDLWRRSGAKSAHWLFFAADGSHRSLSPVAWRPVYDAVDFPLDVAADDPWQPAAGPLPRFTVPLTPLPRRRPVEPSLWLLTEAELPRLEGWLATAGARELDDWLLAIQVRGAVGLFAVRAKRQPPPVLELGGTAFGEFRGLPQLLLPVDWDLQPPLQADRYRTLFELKAGTLTLLWPGEATQILRIPEVVFRPLGSLVDYLIAAQNPLLETWLAKSAFDLGPYARAPQGFRSPEVKLQAPEGTPASKESPPGAEDPTATPDGEVDGGAKAAVAATETGADAKDVEENYPAWRAEEIRAERQLIQGEQTFEAWLALLTLKERLGKWQDACDCAVDALWLCDDPRREATLQGRWRHALGRAIGAEKSAGHDLLKRILQGHTGQPPLNPWLQGIIGEWTNEEVHWRLKVRWLLWRRLLAYNRDERRLTRLRETIRQQLVGEGLSVGEIPAFIRQRLYEDQHFEPKLGDEASVGDSLPSQRHNLARLVDAVSQGQDGLVWPVVQAIVGYAEAQVLGNRQRLRGLVDAGWPATARRPLVAVWVALYLAYGLGNADSEPEADLYGDYRRRRGRLATEVSEFFAAVEASLTARRHHDNPANFLSAEHLSRLYPEGGNLSRGMCYQAAAALEGARGDVAKTLKALAEAEAVARNPANADDLRGLARLVDAMADALSRVRWDARAEDRLQGFRALAPSLGNLGRRGGDPFYYGLKNNSLAQGLIALDQVPLAETLLTRSVQALGDHSVVLDFVDGYAAAFVTVEALALEQRAKLLATMTAGIVRVVRQTAGHQSPVMVCRLYQLLDLAATAAVSQERRAAGLFRQYQHQEEFLLLQRVLQDELPRQPDPG